MLHSDQEPVLVRHGPRASHQSQGEVENANRVINGACRAMWLPLENLLQVADSTRSVEPDEISSEKRRENCICACFWESVHEPSVAIRRKSDVQVHVHANRQSGSEMGHGIWVGKAPMTDEHIIRTENGVQKARSLHRVPPEERFVISELKKVRGLPWNSRAENWNATIATQQDQGPSGRRRVHLTTNVVARHGATPGCSGCVGLGPHTEACRVRLEKALTDERASASPVGAGVTEPAIESQEPAPAAQQEPASSSSSPAAPMPTQNLMNEQMDSPMELGAQERRERKGARPSETPTSEISGRPAVQARPASPPMIVPTAEGSGTVVLSAPASSSKDEMTLGGLYVVDGIDVVATLVPERKMCGSLRQQKRAPPNPRCRTESRNQLRLWTTRIPARRKPLRLTTREQVKKLDSEEVRKERAKEVRELDESEVKMEVDESEIRSTPARKSGQNGWKRERIQTAQQYDIGCVPRKLTLANRDLTRLRQPPFDFCATDFELGSELHAQESKRVDDHRCV